MRYLHLIVTFIIYSCPMSWAYAEESKRLKGNICTDDQKIGVVYLNGVLNTDLIDGDVADSIGVIDTILIKKTKLAEVPNENICINFLYNKTEGALDFIESLAQKIREKKEAKGLEFKWEEVTSILLALDTFGYAPDIETEVQEFIQQQNSESITQGIQNIQNQEEATLDLITDKMVGIIKHTKEDNSIMIRPSIVVSHSQGNLFANLLYDRLANSPELIPEEIMKNKYANLQVASPAAEISAPINDEYKSTTDFVIAPVSALYPNRPTNLKIFDVDQVRSFGENLMGHGFVEFYISDQIYGSFDQNIVANSIYPVESCSLNGCFSLYDSLKLDGNLVKINETNGFKKMSDIFYVKLNKLASKITCSEENAKDFFLEDIGLTTYFEKDGAGNAKRFYIGKMVNGQFDSTGIPQSDFSITAVSTSGESNFIGFAGDTLSEEKILKLNQASSIKITYTNSTNFKDDNSTPLTSFCNVDTMYLDNYSSGYVNLKLMGWGTTSTIQAYSKRRYTSLRISEGQLIDNTVRGSNEYEGTYGNVTNFRDLYFWRFGDELPSEVNNLNQSGQVGNLSYEFDFSGGDKHNRVLAIEACYHFRCITRYVNLSLPIYEVHDSLSPSASVVNLIPIMPVADFNFITTLQGGPESGTQNQYSVQGYPAAYSYLGSRKFYWWHSITKCGTYPSWYQEDVGLWTNVQIIGAGYYYDVGYVLEDNTLEIYYDDPRVRDVEGITVHKTGTSCKVE